MNMVSISLRVALGLAVGAHVALPAEVMAASSTTLASPTAVTRSLERLMREAGVSGAAIAQIEQGQLQWVAVAGERAPGEPVTVDTVFNAASLTKPLFATLFLHQAAEGEMGLDDGLAQDWVDPDIAKDPLRFELTPRLALSHQSGFVNWRGGKPLSFTFAPGERHEYSGEGYEYLRRALERRTQLSYSALALKSIFGPVGMTASYLGWDEQLDGRVAVGFDERGQPHRRGNLRKAKPNAAAYLFTTIGDYGRFAAWVARGADLPPALWHEMQQPQARHQNPAENFGLGWHVLEVDGDAVLWHDGREPGVRNLVVVLPESGEALVLLTNSDNGELLMRALIADRLPNGSAINQTMDRDIWTYLQRMPSEQIAGIARVVSGSPAFLSKLLHAVHTTQIAPGDLPEAKLHAARQSIDAYVHAVRDGQIDREQSAQLVSMLLEDTSAGPAWRDQLSAAQREAWIAALDKRGAGRANRVAAQVSPKLLARYVGQYRVPSSNLLITIERHEQSLRATAAGTPPITLLAMSDTLFFMREDDTRFEFVADADGAVGQLRLLWSGGRSELAQREP